MAVVIFLKMSFYYSANWHRIVVQPNLKRNCDPMENGSKSTMATGHPHARAWMPRLVMRRIARLVFHPLIPDQTPVIRRLSVHLYDLCGLNRSSRFVTYRMETA